MTPFERLQWIDDTRDGTGHDDFDGLASLVSGHLVAEGGKQRLGEWYNKKIDKVSRRILARLTKIVDQSVVHPEQYFDENGLNELFPDGTASRGFARTDACQFSKQIKTAYFTFVNRFTSHNKRTSLKQTSSFGNTIKKGLNKLYQRIHEKMNCP